MIGGLLLGSAVVCNTVEVTVFAVERAAAFATERAAGCDVCVPWAGVEMFAVVDTAAGPALAAVSVLAI